MQQHKPRFYFDYCPHSGFIHKIEGVILQNTLNRLSTCLLFFVFALKDIIGGEYPKCLVFLEVGAIRSIPIELSIDYLNSSSAKALA